MAGGLGWIHFSDTSRKQVMKIVELLGEAGAIDELGIGVVRNAFSNAMFNGITTPMTRAKYFFITSYLFIEYLKNPKGKNLQRYMNTEEMRVIEELTAKYGNKASDQRIIGHTVAKKNLENGGKEDLVTKPTVTYWNGMREFGILKKPHSYSQLISAINTGEYTDKKSGFEAKKDKENGDDDSDQAKWTELFHVPYRPEWRENLSIELTEQEAEELKGKIIETQKDSLLAYLLAHPSVLEEFYELESFDQFPTKSFYKDLPNEIQKTIDTSIAFWHLLEGAHIRFNILIQQKQKDESLIEKFQEQYALWEQTILKNFDWGSFDLDYLWEVTNSYSSSINKNTVVFINNWIAYLKAGKDIKSLDKLVKSQEEQNKNERSKLIKTHKEIYTKWVGISGMSFRLPNVQTIIKDIYKA